MSDSSILSTTGIMNISPQNNTFITSFGDQNNHTAVNNTTTNSTVNNAINYTSNSANKSTETTDVLFRYILSSQPQQNQHLIINNNDNTSNGFMNSNAFEITNTTQAVAQKEPEFFTVLSSIFETDTFL